MGSERPRDVEAPGAMAATYEEVPTMFESNAIDSAFAVRFWSAVRRIDGCWEWKGFRNHNGYGRLTFHGRQYLAHRIAWELTKGASIPKGMHVLHHCDNPPCVRPVHLWLGNDADNMRDRDAKGRGRAGPNAPHLARLSA